MVSTGIFAKVAIGAGYGEPASSLFSQVMEELKPSSQARGSTWNTEKMLIAKQIHQEDES